MIVFRLHLIVLTLSYGTSSGFIFGTLHPPPLFHKDRDSRTRGNDQLRDFKPPPITDDTFKPKSFDAYIELTRQKLNKFGECANNYRFGNVKQMIKNGKLLKSPYIRLKKAIPLEPLFPLRLRRSTNIKLKDEIDSIKIYPIESKGSKAIECHKDTDEEISCKQDDFEYKIKLKHKNLSQESIESLIRSLYIRLSSSIPTEKKKRSDQNIDEPKVNIDKDAPFMIVLPPPEPTAISGCPFTKLVITEWPYKPCKTCDDEDETETSPPLIDQMVIECNPRDFEPAVPGEPRTNPSTKQPSAYIYSCRWQGKRDVETQNILVPLHATNTSRPSRQSFKIIIDPSEASTNSLPITISI